MVVKVILVVLWRTMAIRLKTLNRTLSFIYMIVIPIFINDISVCAERNAALDDTCDINAGRASEHSVACASAGGAASHEISVIITFTNVRDNANLQSKFGTTVSSLFRHTSTPVILYIIGDDVSQKIAKDILERHVADSRKYRVSVDATIF
jgi:hypothetical protein